MSDEDNVTGNTEESGTQDTTVDTVDYEVQHEAESQGWVPKERFRGNEADWVDANTFVKRGREILPILRKNNENLVRDLNSTKEQLREFREAAEAFKKFQKDSFERKAADYENRIKDLKDSRAQAISDGDGQRANLLEDALDEAKSGLADAKQSASEVVMGTTEPKIDTPSVDPTLQVWLDRNTWFGVDKRQTAIVNGIGESLRVEYPSLKGKDFLDKLDEVLAEEFPTRFGSKKRNGSAVESGAGRQGRQPTSAKSYDNLPADAKAACDRFVKQKLMTREAYVADFDWS